jgi:hypothetical protein
VGWDLYSYGEPISWLLLRDIRNVRLLYFSFVTLTTVGYGDISPQTILADRLAIFEAAMGGIYLAVIIVMLVGRYMSMEESQDID